MRVLSSNLQVSMSKSWALSSLEMHLLKREAKQNWGRLVKAKVCKIRLKQMKRKIKTYQFSIMNKVIKSSNNVPSKDISPRV